MIFNGSLNVLLLEYDAFVEEVGFDLITCQDTTLSQCTSTYVISTTRSYDYRLMYSNNVDNPRSNVLGPYTEMFV